MKRKMVCLMAALSFAMAVVMIMEVPTEALAKSILLYDDADVTVTEDVATENVDTQTEDVSTEETSIEEALVTEETTEEEEAEKEAEPLPDPYLNKTEKTMYIGRTFTLKLKYATGRVRWYSSNEAVATVSEEGVVTPVAEGKVKIKAKHKGVKYICEVTVKTPVQNMTYRRIRSGYTVPFKIKGADIVSYKTSDKKVAKVDENGVITAGKKEGVATITAKSACGVKYSCKINVYKNVLDIKNPKFSDLAPTTKMSFEELVGNNGNNTFPVGYPKADTYKVIVDLHYKVVMVYTKDDKGKYTVPVRYMLCSVGADETQTPTGTFKMQAFRVRNSIFNNTTSYAQYWSEIVGRIYFHSILYTSLDAHDYTTTSWNNLGSAVSHGCIRLTVPDARWIWYNIAPGTSVVIRQGSSSDKETALIRSKLKLAKLPSVRPALIKSTIPYTDNWEIADVPNEVKFVQGSQNGGEAAN